MKKYFFEKELFIEAGIKELFEFHRDTNNLKLISPGSLKTEIIKIDTIPLEKDSRIELKISKFGIGIRWKIKILDCEPPNLISDLQESGPFKYWLHYHKFETKAGGTLMTDEVLFSPPLGIVGKPLVPFIKFALKKMFNFRHQKMREVFRENK